MYARTLGFRVVVLSAGVFLSSLLLVGWSSDSLAQSGGNAAQLCNAAMPVNTACVDSDNNSCFVSPSQGLYTCLIEGGGDPHFLTCTPDLAAGTLCRDGTGNPCSVTSPGVYACIDIGVGGAANCLGPDKFPVQACMANGFKEPPAIRQLTDTAINSVLSDHLLPAEDAGRVVNHARHSVRAYLLAEILGVINKEQRTPDEEDLVAYYTEEVHKLRVRQAGASEAEYQKWSANPCGYQPPAGFSYQPPTDCATPLGNLFGTPSHPTVEDFKTYGNAKVNAEDVLSNPEAIVIASGMSNAGMFGLAVAAAAVASALVWVVLSATAIGPLIVAFFLPSAVIPFYFGAFAGIATGLASGLVAVAGAVFAVILAIVGSIFAVIHYANYQAFVDDVTTLVEQAQATVPNLRAEINTKRGMIDFAQVYVKSNQPEWNDDSAPPLPALTDPRFAVCDETCSAASIQVAPTIQLSVDDGKGLPVLALEARLHGGWYVQKVTYLNEAIPPQQVVNETLTLGISFVDWDGESSVAWRRGTQFVIPRVKTDGSAGESIISDELRYIDAAGNKRIATVLVDETPPSISSTVTGTQLNTSGWYASDVSVQWLVSDAESEIIEQTGCAPAVVATDGTHELVCSATSAGGTGTGSLTIRRDTQPPQILASRSPAANSFGWNNTDVQVSYACSDALSGIAQCAATKSFAAEGAGQTAAPGVAVDVAGNQQSSESISISIDKTAPLVSIAVPAEGAYFIVNEPVNAQWVATDALSGVASALAPSASGTPIATAAAGTQAFTVVALDRAGNQTTLSRSYEVLSPAGAADRLVKIIAASNIQDGIAKSLTGQLDKVRSDLAGGGLKNAALKLGAFMNHVAALTGKKIDSATAAVLIAEATRLAASTGVLP